MPPVGTGSAVYHRVGEEIEPLRLKVQLTLSLVTPTFDVNRLTDPQLGTLDSGPEDITAHVYVFFSRRFPNFEDRTNPAFDLNYFLKRAQESNTAYQYQGTHENGKMVVNNQEFKKVHHFAIRLKKAAGYQSYVRMISSNGGDPQREPDQHVQAPALASQVADLTFYIPLPKKLRYQVQASNQPECFTPYMCIGWSSNDYPLESVSSPNLTPLAVTGSCHLWYKDM